MEDLIKRCMPAIHKSARYAAFSFHLDYDDVLSALLERIWRARHSFRHENGDKGFGNWVGFVTHSVCIDLVRKRKKEGISIPVEHAYHVGIEHNIDQKNLLQHVLRHAKEQFSPEFQKITLFLMEGQSYDEMAERLELPLGTVKAKIFRIRKALQAAKFKI